MSEITTKLPISQQRKKRAAYMIVPKEGYTYLDLDLEELVSYLRCQLDPQGLAQAKILNSHIILLCWDFQKRVKREVVELPQCYMNRISMRKIFDYLEVK